MADVRSSYKIYVGKREGKGLHGKYKCEWKYNIKHGEYGCEWKYNIKADLQ
jgi:hypothetical protein